ncbi:nuclease-related domain-containing protein [Sporosarcina sp. 179-K 3D1 HS]|uniref:nuclease-related domain-containing protein n=1 Tax=Sporosarcina sp. 179-K 3D1 HS TaxID=3232169 RepID=UPI0039A12280
MIGIIKIHRQKPELLIALPRLLARLHPTHDKYKDLENQLYRIEAGYAGECRVDKYLETIEFPEPVSIFTDLQLVITPGFTIQIDTLILTPSHAIILEIKNIAGTLSYISHPPHFESIYSENKSIVINCPLMQLNNNKAGLEIWFKRNDYNLQITGLIVLATNTLVKNAPSEMPIVYAKHLRSYLRKWEKGKAPMTLSQFQRMLDELNKDRLWYNPYPLAGKYQLDLGSILQGNLCANCNSQLFRKNKILWTCRNCKLDIKEPYVDSMKDWYMLFKGTITNQECRDFLKLKDKHAARHILRSLPLIRIGKSKATQYTWDYKVSPSQLKKISILSSKN